MTEPGRHPHRSGAWSLIELMIMLSLFGVFLIFAGRLISSTTALSSDVYRMQEAATRFDLIIDRFRRDVWGASAIERADSHTVTLQYHDARQVTWTMYPDTFALIRTTAREEDVIDESYFDGLNFIFRFEHQPASLLVYAQRSIDPDDTARYHLTSRVIQLKDTPEIPDTP